MNVWNCHTVEDLKKAFGYAKRLLPFSKLGVLVSVSKTKMIRSTEQNSYYWGVVIEQIRKAMGHTKDEMHQILAKKFLKIKEIEVDGETFAIVKSTTKLKTDEFEDYLENCRRYAAENLSIVVLLPNESEDMWK